MPDGNRFMKRLAGTGRGWGKAYSLARTNSMFLQGQVIKACADNLRRFTKDDIRRSVDILTVAFERQSHSDKDNITASAKVFLDLKIEFRRLKVEGDYRNNELAVGQSIGFNKNGKFYRKANRRRISN